MKEVDPAEYAAFQSEYLLALEQSSEQLASLTVRELTITITEMLADTLSGDQCSKELPAISEFIARHTESSPLNWLNDGRARILLEHFAKDGDPSSFERLIGREMNSFIEFTSKVAHRIGMDVDDFRFRATLWKDFLASLWDEVSDPGEMPHNMLRSIIKEEYSEIRGEGYSKFRELIRKRKGEGVNSEIFLSMIEEEGISKFLRIDFSLQ